MCVRVHFQHACGHISEEANEIHSCDHRELIWDWEQAQLPGSQDEIDHRNAMCLAESRRSDRTDDSFCPACAAGAAAGAAADAELARLQDEAFERSWGPVKKSVPHKTSQRGGGPPGLKNGE